MEKVVKAPLFNIAAVVAEVQTHKDWIPLCHRSEILAEPSHFRKLVALGYTLPWPFANRVVYMGVTAIPVKNERQFLLSMETAPDEFGDFHVPRENDPPGVVECMIQMLSILIENLGENDQKLRILCNLDP